jgi:hypothetical protein
MEYAAPVWLLRDMTRDSTLFQDMQRLENKALRLVLGAHHSTHVPSLSVESAVLPLKLRLIKQATRFQATSKYMNPTLWKKLEDQSLPNGPLDTIGTVANPLLALDGERKTLKETQHWISFQVQARWQDEWNLMNLGSYHHQMAPLVATRIKTHLKLALPRHLGTLLAQLRMNHINSNETKARLYDPENTSPMCRKCPEEDFETPTHLLLHCQGDPLLTSARRRLAWLLHTEPLNLTTADILGDITLMTPGFSGRQIKKDVMLTILNRIYMTLFHDKN